MALKNMVKEALDCPSRQCIMSGFGLCANSRLSYGLLLRGLRPHQDHTFFITHDNGRGEPDEPVEFEK